MHQYIIRTPQIKKKIKKNSYIIRSQIIIRTDLMNDR